MIKPSSIIHLNQLLELSENPNVKIFDVRTGPDAKEMYHQKHLKNAVFVDLDKDLAHIGDPKNGGRHPLPDFGDFVKTVGKLLRAMGHQYVQVLDGGLQYADSQNYPLSSGADFYPPTEYKTDSKNWELPLIDLCGVKKASENLDFLIVDVREPKRYQGITEPIDLVAGHIPNAENIPFTDNLQDDGLFRSPDVLRQQYSEKLNKTDKDKVIFHCGSGVTACHSLLALDYAGFDIPNLYVGSWSEWSRNEI